MKLNKYIKDKIIIICIYILFVLLILGLMDLFLVKNVLIMFIMILLTMLGIIMLLYSYYRKRKFYNKLLVNLQRLDKKYLINETLSKPNFYEGKILYDSLYEINKSMIENINDYQKNVNDFKEYVEMWIHEVKVPISSLVLMSHNQNDNKYIKQIKRLDNYIDQVLYYVRSENIEKDFIINSIKLDEIVGRVALKNKDDILQNNINLNVELNNISVLTDSKWLEFILNQIINNSIKYKKDISNCIININATEEDKKVILNIYDNGIGISSNDINRVFDKSFTGENGRIKSKSTGMGLYIAKKLCDKLGHKITITSEKDKYTNVEICFFKNDLYKINK